jgi:hypothetical protein
VDSSYSTGSSSNNQGGGAGGTRTTTIYQTSSFTILCKSLFSLKQNSFMAAAANHVTEREREREIDFFHTLDTKFFSARSILQWEEEAAE